MTCVNPVSNCLRSFHFMCNVVTASSRDCYVTFIFNTDVLNAVTGYVSIRLRSDVSIESKRANVNAIQRPIHFYVPIYLIISYLSTYIFLHIISVYVPTNVKTFLSSTTTTMR